MKKIVLEHTQGPTPGQLQIIGAAELLTFGERPLPEHLEGVDLPGRRVQFASLIKVTPRMVLYREAFPKPTGRFGQQIDHWHPDQL